MPQGGVAPLHPPPGAGGPLDPISLTPKAEGAWAPSAFGVKNEWRGPGTIIVPGGGAGAEPPRHNPLSAAQTRSTCASVSSGNIGRLITSDAARAVSAQPAGPIGVRPR